MLNKQSLIHSDVSAVNLFFVALFVHSAGMNLHYIYILIFFSASYIYQYNDEKERANTKSSVNYQLLHSPRYVKNKERHHIIEY